MVSKIYFIVNMGISRNYQISTNIFELILHKSSFTFLNLTYFFEFITLKTDNTVEQLILLLLMNIIYHSKF